MKIGVNTDIVNLEVVRLTEDNFEEVLTILKRWFYDLVYRCAITRLFRRSYLKTIEPHTVYGEEEADIGISICIPLIDVDTEYIGNVNIKLGDLVARNTSDVFFPLKKGYFRFIFMEKQQKTQTYTRPIRRRM